MATQTAKQKELKLSEKNITKILNKKKEKMLNLKEEISELRMELRSIKEEISLIKNN